MPMTFTADQRSIMFYKVMYSGDSVLLTLSRLHISDIMLCHLFVTYIHFLSVSVTLRTLCRRHLQSLCTC